MSWRVWSRAHRPGRSASVALYMVSLIHEYVNEKTMAHNKEHTPFIIVSSKDSLPTFRWWEGFDSLSLYVTITSNVGNGPEIHLVPVVSPSMRLDPVAYHLR